MNSNDLIKNYQLNKLNTVELKNYETVIVGDSSAGNAINAKLFSILSNSKTINLSLTGSWSLTGSLGIAKLVYKKNPNIKNVLIIHTLDIWYRKFVEKSVHEFFSFQERLNYLGMKNIINDEVNVKEIKWLYEYFIKIIKKKKFTKIDYSNDYLEQKKKKMEYEVKSLKLISNDKQREWELLNQFCKEKNINCMYVHGPMYERIIENSKSFFVNINKNLKNSSIVYVNRIFSYPDYMLGDSKDHILPIYKDGVTREYYKAVKQYLE